MNKQRIILHITFWLLAAVFLIWFYTKLTQEYQHTLMLTAAVIPVSIATVYFFNSFLIPKFLFTRQYFRFGLFSFYSLVIAVWISLLIVVLYFTLIITARGGGHPPFNIDIAFLLAGQFMVISAGVLGHAVRSNYNSLKEKTLLERKQLEMDARLKDAELRFMKSQFHPHFLFNTLNNLYALSLKKSNDTPEMILKLSNLLDYSLHASERESVSLWEERDFIRDYLDLATMRFQEKLDIQFSFNAELPEFQIPPMVLMPFVENALKHGINPNGQTSRIEINMKQEAGVFMFSVVNAAYKRNPQSSENSYGGLGLKQVRSRLDSLLAGRYQLDISENQQTYQVNLRINE